MQLKNNNNSKNNYKDTLEKNLKKINIFLNYLMMIFY